MVALTTRQLTWVPFDRPVVQEAPAANWRHFHAQASHELISHSLVHAYLLYPMRLMHLIELAYDSWSNQLKGKLDFLQLRSLHPICR